jgi:hypothetical protein
MMPIIMFNALCEFILRICLNNKNLVKIEFVVESMLLNVGSQVDDVSKPSMFKI